MCRAPDFGNVIKELQPVCYIRNPMGAHPSWAETEAFTPPGVESILQPWKHLAL